MIIKTKELKIYGWLMFFFGFLDLVSLGLNIFGGDQQTGDIGLDKVFFILFVAVGLFIAMAKFWLGRQALCYARGTGKGTSHIVLVKIGMVFGVLSLVNDCVSAFVGADPVSEIFSSAASLIVMISYYQAAKACL